jgi:hypothetical protein
MISMYKVMTPSMTNISPVVRFHAAPEGKDRSKSLVRLLKSTPAETIRKYNINRIPSSGTYEINRKIFIAIQSP